MNAVRLEVFHQMRSFLADAVGAEDAAAFAASLPYALKALLAQEDAGNDWAPAREFSMLMAAVDLQALPQLNHFFLRFGRVFVENHAARFSPDCSAAASLASLFRRSRPAAVMALARQFQADLESLRQWFSPLDAAVDEKFSLQSMRFHLGARPALLPAFCELMLGIAAGILEMRRVPYVRITEEICRLEGHDLCSFLLELEPESPLSFL